MTAAERIAAIDQQIEQLEQERALLASGAVQPAGTDKYPIVQPRGCGPSKCCEPAGTVTSYDGPVPPAVAFVPTEGDWRITSDGEPEGIPAYLAGDWCQAKGDTHDHRS